MAYKKRYRKRRTGKGRTRGGKTKKLVTGQKQPTLLETIASGIGGVATVAKAVLPIVSAINTENKYIDTVSNQAVSLAAPMIQCLNLCPQGTDENNRIGNSMLLRDLNIRISIIPNFSTDRFNLMRMIIFVDKQQVGNVTGAPTAAQLLQNSGNIDSPFNRNFTDRFVIIKDKRLVISLDGDKQSIFTKVYKKLEFHARYIGTGATSASLGNNALYIYITSTQVTTLPTAYIYSRVNFTDN